MLAKSIRGSGKGGTPLTTGSVNAPYLMHHLNAGVYQPKGTGYAQAICLNPQSRHDLEIDREHPELKINYKFFSDKKQYETDKSFFIRGRIVIVSYGFW